LVTTVNQARVSRRLVGSETIKLPKLDRAIQAAFGWTNSHVHEYIIVGVWYAYPDQEWTEELKQVDETKIARLDALGYEARALTTSMTSETTGITSRPWKIGISKLPPHPPVHPSGAECCLHLWCLHHRASTCHANAKVAKPLGCESALNIDPGISSSCMPKQQVAAPVGVQSARRFTGAGLKRDRHGLAR
jgi:hypothetical protein